MLKNKIMTFCTPSSTLSSQFSEFIQSKCILSSYESKTSGAQIFDGDTEILKDRIYKRVCILPCSLQLREAGWNLLLCSRITWLESYTRLQEE